MPLLADTYDWMSAWPTEWPNVKMTLHCSILGHQMPLWEATSDWMSAWSKGWPNVKMTWYCTLFEHQMPLLGVHLNEYQPKPKDDQMSRWLDIALFLTTRWLYWRLHLTECQLDPKGWTNVKMTWFSTILGHDMPLSRVMFDWISAWHMPMTKYRMTWCSYHSWPPWMPLLGVHLTKYQLDLKDDQMSRWPDIVPFLSSSCLYWGHIWLNVRLTQRMNKCQDELT